jgi:tetratricopeptide (TPR) repeat protein
VSWRCGSPRPNRKAIAEAICEAVTRPTHASIIASARLKAPIPQGNAELYAAILTSFTLRLTKFSFPNRWARVRSLHRSPLKIDPAPMSDATRSWLVGAHEENVWAEMAQTLEKAGKNALALEANRRALSVSPENDEIRCRLARILFRRGLIDEAIKCYADVTVLSLSDFNEFCNIVTRVGAFATLEEVTDRYEIAAPAYKFRSVLARAYMWRHRGRPDLERACFQDAQYLAAKHGQPVLEEEAREGVRDWTIGHGQQRDVLAALAAGFAASEAREVSLDRITDIHTFDKQEGFNISTDVAFAHALRVFEQNGTNPRVHVDARMAALFERSFPYLDVRTYRTGNAPDMTSGTAVHLRELPFAVLKAGVATADGPCAFLKSDTARAEPGPDGPRDFENRRFRVGICWRSSSAINEGFQSSEAMLSRNRIDFDRYLDLGNRFWRKCVNLPYFRPIIEHSNLDVVFVQYGLAPWEAMHLGNHPTYRSISVADLNHFGDIDAIARELNTLDALFTVPNAYAHLAAALGVPTFVLLHDQPPVYWSWIKRFPIYPSVRTIEKEPEWNNGNMVTRKYDGDWTPPIRTALEEFCEMAGI